MLSDIDCVAGHHDVATFSLAQQVFAQDRCYYTNSNDRYSDLTECRMRSAQKVPGLN